jgi:hypothetical protein
MAEIGSPIKLRDTGMISRVRKLPHDQCIGVGWKGAIPQASETTTGLLPRPWHGRLAAGSRGASKVGEALPAAGCTQRAGTGSHGHR